MFQKYYGIPKDAKYGEPFMSRFPILFQQRSKSMQETCMCWGIEAPRGWYHILEQLCTALEYINMKAVKEYNCAIVADQVKEKYGTLRFYYTIHVVDDDGIVAKIDESGEYTGNISNKLIDNKRRIVVDYLDMLADKFIDEAENLTENTCARCGIPLDKDNKVETQGWITYLCKECDKKIQPNEDDEDDTLEIQGEDVVNKNNNN